VSRVVRLALALVAVCLVACDDDAPAPSPSSEAPAATETTTANTAEAAAPSRAASWTTYGGASSRAGVVHGAPAAPELRKRFTRAVDGEVYAQPLIAGGRIYVATENNTVYAFGTGGKLVWKRHLGAPVPGGDLPCGNIDPSGITGTPVIAGGRIYAVAFLRSGHKHVLFGLRLGNGSVAIRANVDPANRTVQQQRGALLAAHGRVYVPYGGLFGDCGPFRGVVVSRTLGGRSKISYVTPATEAGIWSPAGPSAQSGTLLVSTGNGGGGAVGDQNSVVRLSERLRRLSFFAPRNWRELSAGDVDLSSLTPLPVSGGHVLQAGKEGVAYLLPHSLGGVGRQLHSARLCDGGAFGAAAFRKPMAIVPCGGSLSGVRVENGRFRVAWSSPNAGLVAVIAGNSVFSITRDGTLNQLRFSTGKRVASQQIGGGATSFPAPAAAGRVLVAPTGRGIAVFSL
jgi:outer membrane protein assembly factor BamB